MFGLAFVSASFCATALHMASGVACNKAFEAYYIQSGIKPKMEAVQSKVEGYANQQVTQYVPQSVIATSSTAYILLVKKQVNVNIPLKRFAESSRLSADLNKVQIDFGWSFR